MNKIDQMIGNIIGSSKKKSKKNNNMFNFNKIISSTKSTKGASIKMQNMWKGFSSIQKNQMRIKFPDSDGDRIPNKFDCQPFNVMRQDTNSYDVSQLSEKFFYVNNKFMADLALKLWGWNSINEFPYNYEDLMGAFFQLTDNEITKVPSGTKIYNAAQVKASGKPILLIFGNPSRLIKESFDEYMGMWYRVDEDRYIDKMVK